MDDASRYQLEFDTLMRELESTAKRRADLDREAAWKIMEKSFNAMAVANNWTEEKREAAKKNALDDIFSD